MISDCSREEIVVRNAMLRNASKKVFLCDSTKYGMTAPCKQCELRDVDYLISDGNMGERFSALAPALTIL